MDRGEAGRVAGLPQDSKGWEQWSGAPAPAIMGLPQETPSRLAGDTVKGTEAGT